MSAHLVINDGNPWWASPDIWVVPGNDPNGGPGSPIAGTANYVWARATNAGNVAVNGARIDFYWANPAAAVVVGVATFIGSAFADLAPNATQDVLCLVPWHPVIVNGGHECVLAVIHGAGDQNPLPDPLPNGYAFDPPAHDQIAQLNVSVLQAAMLRMPQTLYVHALPREAKRARVSVEVGGRLDERVLANLGLKGLEPAQHICVEVGLGRVPACHDPDAVRELELDVPRGGTAPVFVHLQAERLPHGQYQLVHIVERSGERVTGGVSYAIVNTRHHHEPAGKEQAA
ncbi:MAG TPA: hypothetical protein VFF16_10885 [Telluria sp.]|nr:hypothetical protein [Telluria sp.]